jgi:hypothetical protein
VHLNQSDDGAGRGELNRRRGGVIQEMVGEQLVKVAAEFHVVVPRKPQRVGLLEQLE